MRTVIMIYEETPEISQVFLFRNIGEDEYNKLLSFSNIFIGEKWKPEMDLSQEEYSKKEEEMAEFFYGKDGDKFQIDDRKIEPPIKDFHVDAIIRTGYILP